MDETRVRLDDGSVHLAEIHWCEVGGIGRKEFKIKHLLAESTMPRSQSKHLVVCVKNDGYLGCPIAAKV